MGRMGLQPPLRLTRLEAPLMLAGLEPSLTTARPQPPSPTIAHLQPLVKTAGLQPPLMTARLRPRLRTAGLQPPRKLAGLTPVLMFTYLQPWLSWSELTWTSGTSWMMTWESCSRGSTLRLSRGHGRALSEIRTSAARPLGFEGRLPVGFSLTGYIACTLGKA